MFDLFQSLICKFTAKNIFIKGVKKVGVGLKSLNVELGEDHFHLLSITQLVNYTKILHISLQLLVDP